MLIIKLSSGSAEPPLWNVSAGMKMASPGDMQ
jgi:hypothetical protein